MREKRPEFYKKHTNFRNYNVLKENRQKRGIWARNRCCTQRICSQTEWNAMYDRDAASQTLHPRCMQWLLGIAWSTSQGRRGREHGWRNSRTFVCPKSSSEKNPAVFVHQAQQFDHVLCRIEGEVRLHQFQNPLKFSSDHLLLQTVTIILTWPE